MKRVLPLAPSFEAEIKAALDPERRPAWIYKIPSDVLFSTDVAQWLTVSGLPRPSLIQLAAERRLRRAWGERPEPLARRRPRPA